MGLVVVGLVAVGLVVVGLGFGVVGIIVVVVAGAGFTVDVPPQIQCDDGQFGGL